jgi:ParB family chromosome partitioning protein
MNANIKKPVLGKGLKALIPQNLQDAGGIVSELLKDETRRVHSVPIELLLPNPEQPRKNFDEKALGELAESIREHGILQPIIARKDEKNWIIVVGERRWRAAQLAGLKEVPVLPVSAEKDDLLLLALIENLQRADLNPLEEAQAFHRLKDEYGLSQQEISERVGKSRPVIANAMRLLELPKEAQEAIRKGDLTAGHAKVLLSIPEKRTLISLVGKIKEKGLSVRELERKIGAAKENAGVTSSRKQKPLPPSSQRLVSGLEHVLAMKIELKIKSNQQGRLIIHYNSLDELDRILDKLYGKRM